jgi:hypothetical protein
MSDVVCPNCGKSSFVAGAPPTSSECPFCFEELVVSSVDETSPESREIAGLTLIYQINQQRIDIQASGQTILGREASGANVLSNIFFNGKQVISRRHCSIEFRDNRFYLQDEGSLNGTFYGPGKTSCRESSQVIENGELLYMGEEPFLAKVRMRSAKVPAQSSAGEPPVQTRYRCNESFCGHEMEIPPGDGICPGCRAFNSFVQISF